MHARRLADSAVRTYVVVFETGDEVMEGMKSFAAENDLAAASFTAIGAWQEADLGAYDLATKSYTDIKVREQVEVVSFSGDLTHDTENGYTVHAHVVVSKHDGPALGGHVMRAVVRPTLEVFVTASPTRLNRRYDEDSGLNLIVAD